MQLSKFLAIFLVAVLAFAALARAMPEPVAEDEIESPEAEVELAERDFKKDHHFDNHHKFVPVPKVSFLASFASGQVSSHAANGTDHPTLLFTLPFRIGLQVVTVTVVRTVSFFACATRVLGLTLASFLPSCRFRRSSVGTSLMHARPFDKPWAPILSTLANCFFRLLFFLPSLELLSSHCHRKLCAFAIVSGTV